MAKRNKPRAGSLQFKPRKRAKKETPRIHSWPERDKVGLLGFAGYKAGMTHVLAINNTRNSPTYGMEVFIPVTVIETPPMVAVGIRAYVNGYFGKEVIMDIWAENLSEEMRKRMRMKKKEKTEKKLKELEEKIDQISDIRLIMHTQPKLLSIPKKKPDVMEISISGTIREKFEFARESLGKEIKINDVFSENEFIDVVAVTKGKGYQGPVKRFGIKIQPRKAGKGRRHIGTGGAWTPARKLWREPLPGQLGYHTRTEYNKLILKIGDDGKEVTPKGDFLHYGPVRNSYILVKGSVPGPAKRLIRLTFNRREHKEENYDITYISLESKQGV
ncbi:MAG: 50S ribosomal protein L3 [Candidatus Altiarchaeales archaeon]|nr:MAG: 50S ribosomal protein L3 [Candidatus Altiarchaeales archaeon]RLI95474.1 MAG: 50S ribosomal protein L3 [Candidatus Altiarchaeales archaeon]HDO82589.1 50S ribosomal protein L3 [Candidatus Altiarchaeales archaeon]HEX55238.1 50S ribosomal protein L3 [Candidatus Altiarchaeales archaeon]